MAALKRPYATTTTTSSDDGSSDSDATRSPSASPAQRHGLVRYVDLRRPGQPPESPTKKHKTASWSYYRIKVNYRAAFEQRLNAQLPGGGIPEDCLRDASLAAWYQSDEYKELVAEGDATDGEGAEDDDPIEEYPSDDEQPAAAKPSPPATAPPTPSTEDRLRAWQAWRTTAAAAAVEPQRPTCCVCDNDGKTHDVVLHFIQCRHHICRGCLMFLASKVTDVAEEVRPGVVRSHPDCFRCPQCRTITSLDDVESEEMTNLTVRMSGDNSDTVIRVDIRESVEVLYALLKHYAYPTNGVLYLRNARVTAPAPTALRMYGVARPRDSLIVKRG